VVANILRTDMAAHRRLPTDSELAQDIGVLARAQQDAVWDRAQAHNRLRRLLREFSPSDLGRLHHQARRHHVGRGVVDPGRRPNPGRRGPTDQDPTTGTAEKAGRCWAKFVERGVVGTGCGGQPERGRSSPHVGLRRRISIS